MIRQAAFSSVNFGSKEKPSAVKKSLEALRLATGRLTKIIRDIGRLVSVGENLVVGFL
jgi:hypothetical protein